jgi:hypothetical protein
MTLHKVLLCFGKSSVPDPDVAALPMSKILKSITNPDQVKLNERSTNRAGDNDGGATINTFFHFLLTWNTCPSFRVYGQLVEKNIKSTAFSAIALPTAIHPGLNMNTKKLACAQYKQSRSSRC